MLTRILCVLVWALSASSLAANDIGTVNFDFDSAVLDETAQAEIARIATRLKENPSYKQTVVIGYTDAVGGLNYNDRLGQRRANAVAAALRAQGVDVDRIGDVSSRGKRELLVSIAGPERLNRRVTVSLGDIMAACRSYREIPLTQTSVGEELQQDLEARLLEAVNTYTELAALRRDGSAFQMAGSAREDCTIAVSYDADALRKVEYAQKCFCSSARMRVALN